MAVPQAFITTVFTMLAGLCAACSVYDQGLLAESRPSSLPIHGAAGGGDGSESAAGSGAAPTAGTPATAPRCGDGLVDATELCDTGIAAGLPGACPVTCTSTMPCAPSTRVGSGCNVQCVFAALSCVTGDHCCPADCNAASDGDCSATCGDGIVQSSRGETCEMTATTDAAMRCPTLADCTDHDPCTLDTLTGSAENCNAACSHAAVTTLQTGDGCCPSGANANTDGDCTPKCGNGVREGSEACDGGAGCDSSCKVTLTPAQLACIGDGNRTSCVGCECLSCATQMTGCSNSGNAARDSACKAVEACAIAHNCAGQACYCGTADPVLGCGLFANGPCKAVIEAAVAIPLPLYIQGDFNNPDTALGRASALGICRRSACASSCL